jgi:hypothetical protein
MAFRFGQERSIVFDVDLLFFAPLLRQQLGHYRLPVFHPQLRAMDRPAEPDKTLPLSVNS